MARCPFSQHVVISGQAFRLVVRLAGVSSSRSTGVWARLLWLVKPRRCSQILLIIILQHPPRPGSRVPIVVLKLYFLYFLYVPETLFICVSL